MSGEAKRTKSSFQGTYYLDQSKTVNDVETWKSSEGESAIWYSLTWDCWVVGQSSEIGKESYNIRGPPKNSNWPNQITEGWELCSVSLFKTKWTKSGDISCK